jgi:hypothetical protein
MMFFIIRGESVYKMYEDCGDNTFVPIGRFEYKKRQVHFYAYKKLSFIRSKVVTEILFYVSDGSPLMDDPIDHSWCVVDTLPLPKSQSKITRY